MANKYDQLVTDLKSGQVNLKMIDQAFTKYMLDRKDIPESVKDILVRPGGGGMVRDLFQQISRVIGNVELAYRRGASRGIDIMNEQKQAQ